MIISPVVWPDYDALCREVAREIAALIRRKPDATLGLATGSTPIGVYRELIRLHREENLDFSGVTTFNLDEYYPMPPQAPQSYHRFMREQLFDFINCRNWYVPDGRKRDEAALIADCQKYEDSIARAGGLDLQLLGIGRTGHIGFNEPGSPLESRTRLVTIDSLTRADAAASFGGLSNVPVRAITMGVGTILEARRIIVMANGARKAAIVREALEGKITSKIPASFLREHPKVLWAFDEAAASALQSHARANQPVDMSRFEMRRRALIEAAQQSQKPLSQLISSVESVSSLPAPAEAIAEVEGDFAVRLDDEKWLPRAAKVLCLAPHPDDDVICCGATLIKLVERANRVTIAYGVSGSHAVRDKDVLALLRAGQTRLADYLQSLWPDTTPESALDALRREIFERENGAPDSILLRNLKRLVREGEATDACLKMGAAPRFLDLPFYYQSAAAAPIGPDDIEKTRLVLRETQPDLVLLTGEMNDPHGTHERCAQAFTAASLKYFEGGGKPFARWNYRGAWNEYALWQGDYFSVFDKAQMERKIGLILDHVSQLDPLFPGATDRREFYERARDRNRDSARALQQLGVLPPTRSFDPIYAEVFQVEPETK